MENPNTIRVAAAVADTKVVTLYLEDGNQLVIKQTDHRLKDLLDAIIPITTKGEIAVISLDDFSVYAAFEKKTGGLTKFFKVAKSKVFGFFGSKEEPEVVKITDTEAQQALVNAVNGINAERETVMVPGALMASQTSVNTVLEHGTPMLESDAAGPDEVIVAVVGTPGNQKVIPGVGNLKPMIEHAVRSNKPEAVQNFLNRCAQFIDKRQHSVEDLMRFLEKGDLPLTEDGSIIAYKMLNWDNRNAGIMQDCHSGNIKQKVGDYVCVDEKLVDLTRRNECSNGLHIARRGYLSGFGGAVCVLCKIDPEDVMVVPHYDANKVRVKGYHILGILSAEAMALLKQNKPMTGEEDALRMVYDAIRGNHVGRLREVKAHAQMGGDVRVTMLRGPKMLGEANEAVTGADLSKAAALDDEQSITEGVSPRDINKRLAEEYHNNDIAENDAGVEPEENEDDIEGSEGDNPDEWDNQEDLEAAAEFHDKVVENGGTNEGMGGSIAESEISEAIANSAPEPVPVPVAESKAQRDARKKREKRAAKKQAEADRQTAKAPVPEAVIKAATGKSAKAPKPSVEPAPAEQKKTASKKPVKATPEAVKTPPPVETGKALTKAEQARKLFIDKKFVALKAFKKDAKKSWTVLGFNDAEIKKIEG